MIKKFFVKDIAKEFKGQSEWKIDTFFYTDRKRNKLYDSSNI